MAAEVLLRRSLLALTLSSTVIEKCIRWVIMLAGLGVRRMKTTLCTHVGIEVPIIQALMGGAVGPALASAVSNAGRLGMLVLWYADAATHAQADPGDRGADV
jgi:hypothetical protein